MTTAFAAGGSATKAKTTTVTVVVGDTAGVNGPMTMTVTPDGPDVATVAATCKAAAPVVERMTALLLREKVLVRLDTLVFHADTLARLKEEIAGLKAQAPAGRATVDVAAFKDRYGVSRKFAIPLLEFLDRERVTRRTGDVRLVL